MGFELAAEILGLGRRQGEHEWTLDVFVQPMHRPDAMFDGRATSEGRQTEPLRELLQVLIQCRLIRVLPTGRGKGGGQGQSDNGSSLDYQRTDISLGLSLVETALGDEADRLLDDGDALVRAEMSKQRQTRRQCQPRTHWLAYIASVPARRQPAMPWPSCRATETGRRVVGRRQPAAG
jgi:hypothetical protein